MQFPALSMSQYQSIFGSSNSHEQQTSFFFERLMIVLSNRTFVRDQVLFDAIELHIGKFQALRRVQCHHGHRTGFLIERINVLGQARGFQKTT